MPAKENKPTREPPESVKNWLDQWYEQKQFERLNQFVARAKAAGATRRQVITYAGWIFGASATGVAGAIYASQPAQAAATGEIGTASDPLDILYADEIGQSSDPVTAIYTDKTTTTALGLGSAANKTISTGSISYGDDGYIQVNGESGAADDLDNATGGTDGDILILHPGSETITIRDAQGGEGALVLDGGTNISMDNVQDRAMFIYDAGIGSGVWVELSRTNPQ